MRTWLRVGGASVCLAVVLVLQGSARSLPAPPRPAEPAVSPQARAYLAEALQLIKTRALDRYRIDWVAEERRAFARTAGARTPSDTYPAISAAIKALGNPHSFLVPAEAAQAAQQESADVERAPDGQLIGAKLGYITTPGIRGDGAAASAYVRIGAAAVRGIDRSSPCGWIVNLRHADGGNMYPLLAVLAPVLGEGTVGYFQDADGQRTAWGIRDGTPVLNGQPAAPGNNYRLHRPRPPVALLTGPATASAGEAALVAFKGRDQTKVFGQPTAGYATGNDAFALTDGALLILTTVNDVDRTGRVYDNTPIAPDEPVAEAPTGDAPLQAAAAWLGRQPACRR